MPQPAGTQSSSSNQKKKHVILQALANPRTAAVLLLGFSSGIPLALTGSTLQAWMKTEGLNIEQIGLFSLVGIPYGFKFLWSPLMDRFVPPLLGRRRGWMLLSQLALAVSIALLGMTSPTNTLWLTTAIAVSVAFFSASQDIVIDAYRTDVLHENERGPGAAGYILGYRIAMLVSGALALVLADQMPWRSVYLVMAGTMAVGVLTSFFAPAVPDENALAPHSLSEAVFKPFVEFFRRKGAFEVLLFILIYKLDVIMATALTTPFMMEIGFTKTDIGVVTKGFGLAATIAGTVTGGALMIKLGMKRSLLAFGLLQAISGASFMLLAHLGHSYPAMVAAIAAENFCSGLGTTAFSAFMMSICDKRYTATQFALLTSLMAQARVIGGAPTGYLAKALGWENFFLLSIFIAVPGLLLLTRFDKWKKAEISSG